MITQQVETTFRRGAAATALALFVILAAACGESNAASGAPDSGRTLAAPGASREEIERTNEQIWRIRASDLESAPTAERTPVNKAYCAAQGAPCIEP